MAAPTAGPESVPGAAAIIAAGFEPIELLTGTFWVVDAWPEDHKRSVPETRPEWMGDQPAGALWFVRSPWSGMSARQALSVLWDNLPRDDEARWPAAAAEVFSWPSERAVAAIPAGSA